MGISPDIQRAIEIIDQRIQSLQRIREMLIKEFGGDEAAFSKIEGFAQESLFPRKRPIKTKKQSLFEFLKTNGPALRKDIEAKSGLAKGTIAFALNDKEVFQRLPDGRWTIR